MTFLQFIKEIIFGVPKGRGRAAAHAIDRAKVHERWRHIEDLMTQGRPSNFKTAVMEADKLLDYVLKGLGYRGETMGERMKSIPREKYDRSFFDAMWGAHKLRNELAHNFEYEVMDFEARRAIADFKKTLRELGVL